MMLLALTFTATGADTQTVESVDEPILVDATDR
jgi:hypothetical protein